MNNQNNCWTDKLLNNTMFSDDENNYNIIDSFDTLDQEILIEETHPTPPKRKPQQFDFGSRC